MKLNTVLDELSMVFGNRSVAPKIHGPQTQVRFLATPRAASHAPAAADLPVFLPIVPHGDAT